MTSVDWNTYPVVRWADVPEVEVVLLNRPEIASSGAGEPSSRPTAAELEDMTPEQLEEIPGIGEKTLEKISVAVRHYFGEYEEGEERPAPAPGTDAAGVAEAAQLEAAQSDEEIAALEQDLTQAGEETASADGSGLITDEVAEERIAELTEEGEALDGEGAESLVPGREDTSEVLAEHEAVAEAEDNDAVLEGNVEEVRDEETDASKENE